MAHTISHKLIEGCCKNEHPAQMELYSLLFGMVYGSALRILKNSHDAEEVAQEAFLRLFQNIKRYKEHIPQTVRRIAINVSIDLLRQRKVQMVELVSQYDADLNDDPDVEYHVKLVNDIGKIKKAINMLPDGYRLVLTLRLLEDMSFGEIAELLKIAESTARSQFMRARQRVAELVENGVATS